MQITSVLHIQTAIAQALLAATQNTLRTKTVHSEIIWALNPSNNVSYLGKSYVLTSDYSSHRSLRRYGAMASLMTALRSLLFALTLSPHWM